VHTFIRELWGYPVKSLGSVRVEQAAIATAGFLGGGHAVVEEKNTVLDFGEIA
jgi:uncharacterized protein YcbX